MTQSACDAKALMSHVFDPVCVQRTLTNCLNLRTYAIMQADSLTSVKKGNLRGIQLKQQ